jgi:hypothetical protein
MSISVSASISVGQSTRLHCGAVLPQPVQARVEGGGEGGRARQVAQAEGVFWWGLVVGCFGGLLWWVALVVGVFKKVREKYCRGGAWP